MSNKIDWSKAPEGATHYTPKGTGVYAAFWRKHCGEWKDVWVIEGQDGSVVHYKGPSSPFFESLAVERPTTPLWSGEGLPPVGVVCMAGCEQVVIVAHHCNGIHAIYAESESDGLLYYGEPNEFRPIRTPEKIAADEREAAIVEMSRHALVTYSPSTLIQKGWLENLYDAGYRKP